MAEPAHTSPATRRRGRLDAERAPLDAGDFPGCRRVHIPRDEIEDHEGRLEYWEARTATAMVCEAVTIYHELPSQRLARLAGLIAASSGSAIETYGTCDLVRFDSLGKPRVLMQADQIVYLRAASADELGPRVDVDGGRLPDVVLEVDYSTDVRVRKLPLYEAWGFPEVWVDVPDARSASRPKSRLPGLTIHVLDGGRFRTVSGSRAFPGWTAEEIHRALNERSMSDLTEDALHRVGSAMGVAEGTGPDDDPWLRRHRDESRAEGRAEGRYESVLAVLEARGIAVGPALPTRVADLGDLPAAAVMGAALRCRSEEEFLAACSAMFRRKPSD